MARFFRGTIRKVILVFLLGTILLSLSPLPGCALFKKEEPEKMTMDDFMSSPRP